MLKLIANWVLNGLAMYIVANIIPGITIASFGDALVVVLVMGLVNAVIKPILLLLTLPITILTLGLFTFVINALLFLLVAQIVPGFHVDGFWTALLGSLLLSIISTLLQSLVR